MVESGSVTTSADEGLAARTDDVVQRRRPAGSAQVQLALARARHWIHRHRYHFTTCVVTLLLHAIVMAALGFVFVPTKLEEELFSLFTVPVRAEDEEDEERDPTPVEENIKPETLIEADIDSTIASVLSTEVADIPSPLERDINDQAVLSELELLNAESVLKTLSGDFGGRSDKGKQAALRRFGGTAESERAVNTGLAWLASIQRPNGSWDFDEVGGVGGAGKLTECQMGATAMALLCYLGGGHTHTEEGKYQQTVHKGLKYLIDHATIVNFEADLRGTIVGNEGMYTQGLATIALCEAHALTRDDETLRRTAQAAVNFIVRAQHRKNGGWRYKPGEEGDTSVVGWQVMALKSAQAGRLRVQSQVYPRARDFLRSVQVDDGVWYGYKTPQKRPSTTAVGLLCRMYLGWQRNKEPLIRGVEYLSKRGPDRENMYYNYYATQVMHHWGGAAWKKWNDVMRPQLVESQVTEGPAAGSWNPRDPHAGPGGRLYETALCIMTLEVYYRHLPLYRRQSIEF